MAASSASLAAILGNILKFIATMITVVICTEYARATTEEFTDFLLCRNCGHSVVRSIHTVNIPCLLAIRERNDTLSGRKDILIQRFVNPTGEQFELITSETADVVSLEEKSTVMTWFDNYAWQVAVCPRCKLQLGWTYTLEEGATAPLNALKSFYGLILDNLLEQSEAESIISQPKFRAYGS